MGHVRRLTVVFAALLGLAAASHAQISADLTVASHYGWRGADVLGGAKLPVQPSVTYAHDIGLSANVWASFGLLDRDSGVDLGDEIDFAVDFSNDINEQFGYSVGTIVYYLPSADGVDPTLEVYGVVAAAMPGSPSVTFYYDTSLLDDADGMYFSLGGGHSIPVADYSVDLGASLGYNPDTSYDVGLTVSVPVPVGSVALSPFGSFTYAADDVNPDNTMLFGGITASYAF